MRGAHDGRMNGFSVITQRTSFAAHIKSSITQTCNKIHTDTLERSRKKNASDSLEIVGGITTTTATTTTTTVLKRSIVTFIINDDVRGKQ